MYYFPNTVWRLPDLAEDEDHPGVVIQVEAVYAKVLLCTHREPKKSEPTVPITDAPFDAKVTHVYLRILRVVGLPLTSKCKGNLSAEQLEHILNQYLLWK